MQAAHILGTFHQAAVSETHPVQVNQLKSVMSVQLLVKYVIYVEVIVDETFGMKISSVCRKLIQKQGHFLFIDFRIVPEVCNGPVIRI